jgi:hypothetical protein
VASRAEAARVLLLPGHAPEVRVQQGIEEPRPQGWYAARPGDRRPAPVVSLLAHGRLPLVFGYALLPRADPPAALHFEHDAFRLRATLRTDEHEYLLTVLQGDVEMRERTAPA